MTDETSLTCVVIPNASISILLYLLSASDGFLLVKVIGLRMLLLGVSSCWHLVLSLVCSSPAPSPTPDTFASKYIGLVSL